VRLGTATKGAAGGRRGPQGAAGGRRGPQGHS